MARLGVATIDEMVGRTDLLTVSDSVQEPHKGKVDLSAILNNPYVGKGKVTFDPKAVYNFNLEKIMKKIDDNSSEEKIFSLLKKEYQPKNKFNIGDKVDFVNDYGVIFKDHTITNFTLYEFGGYLYDTDKNDTSWFWKREKNLHLAGTYIEPVIDLELNNGLVAKFSHFDDWDNKVFTIELEPNSVNVVLVDGALHSISDCDEPIEPLIEKYQPKKDLL